MTEPVRVLQLAGSPVDESFAELSRLYATGCVDALADLDRYEFVLAHVDPGGRWRFPTTFAPGDLAATPALKTVDALEVLANSGIDLALPHLFCIPGMTQYRSVLELLDIDYVGNRPATMALTADKVRTRAVVAAAGVPVPQGEVVDCNGFPTLDPPVVVKPATSDNSAGVSLVVDPTDFPAALARARAVSEPVLVERFVPPGREVRCGVIVRDGELVCLPLEEYAVDSDAKPIRDAADKLARDDDGTLYLSSKIGERSWIVDPADPITTSVWAAARHCHRALGCRHYSLFDFRIDPDGGVWFLEAGLYNSFARNSVVTTMARAAGIGVHELFETAVGELHREHSENRRS